MIPLPTDEGPAEPGGLITGIVDTVGTREPGTEAPGFHRVLVPVSPTLIVHVHWLVGTTRPPARGDHITAMVRFVVDASCLDMNDESADVRNAKEDQ